MRKIFALLLTGLVIACGTKTEEQKTDAVLLKSGHNKTMAMNMLKDSAQYSEAEMLSVAKFFSEKVAYQISIPLLQKITSIYPENTAAKLLLANNLRETQDYNTSLALYNELVNVDSIEFVVLPERARLYIALQEFDQAELDIQRARGLQPKYFAVFLADGLLQYAQGRQQEALDLFDVAINLDPGVSSEASLNAGFILLRNNLNYDALGNFTKAISIGKNINKGYAFVNRGVCQLNLQDTAFACNDFDSAMHYMPNETQWYVDKFCEGIASKERYEIRDSEIKK